MRIWERNTDDFMQGIVMGCPRPASRAGNGSPVQGLQMARNGSVFLQSKGRCERRLVLFRRGKGGERMTKEESLLKDVEKLAKEGNTILIYLKDGITITIKPERKNGEVNETANLRNDERGG